MVRPNYPGPAVLVSLSIYVLNIPSININKHTGELTLEMFYRQIWTDSRLKFDQAGFLGVAFTSMLKHFSCEGSCEKDCWWTGNSGQDLGAGHLRLQ